MAKRATCEFTKDSTTIEIPGPATSNVRNTPQYARSETPSGQHWVYKGRSSARDVWILEFKGLGNTDKDNLQDFFDTTVGGPGVSFTYEHTDEESYTARFLQDSLQFTPEFPGWWNITLEIEVNGRVSL